MGQAEFKDLAAQQMVWLTALNGVGKVEADKQPGDTFFDYFRYYAKDFPGHNLLPNGDFGYNCGKTPESPIAWVQEGTDGAIKVVNGDAASDACYLRVGNGTDFDIRLFQKLEYIRNGTYHLTAKVRNPGGKVKATIDVNGRTVVVPASENWTSVEIDGINVSGKTAAVALKAVGDGGNHLCIDGIRFFKPVPAGQPQPPVRPFNLVRDPIWQIAMNHPIDFTGDSSFFFISREVGFGDAMTLSVDLTPGVVASMCPITRAPATGKNGWAMLLGDKGEVAFRVGSRKDFSEVIASRAYAADKRVNIRCVYEKGTAAIYINGRKAAEKSGIAQGIKDSTQAGTFGATLSGFDAVGEVIGESANNKPKGKTRNYIGRISDLRIYNRVAE